MWKDELDGYAVFETGDGAVCRHHTLAWHRELFSEFSIVESRDIGVDTMNGNAAVATQMLLAKH